MTILLANLIGFGVFMAAALCVDYASRRRFRKQCERIFGNRGQS